MKRFSLVLLAICLLLSLAACGGASKDDVTFNDAGYYDGYSLTNSSGTHNRAAMDAQGISIFLDLKDDGTGVLDMGGGDAIALTWSDGSVTAGGGTVPYTLADGILTLDLSDSDGAFVLVFQKGEPASAETPVSADAPVPEETPELENTPEPEDVPVADDGGLAGYYIPLRVIEQGEAVDMPGDSEYLYLDLRADGTGTACFFDPSEITWTENSMTIEGETVPLTVGEDGSVTVDLSEPDYELIFTFIKGERPAVQSKPQVSALSIAPSEPVEASELPVVWDTDAFHIEIIGAELFTDIDGNDAIRIYYDFTNDPDTDAVAAPWLALDRTASQGGEELWETYTEEDVPEYGNVYSSIEPGVTIRCIEEYALISADGVTFALSDWNDDSVSAVFDPSALPGRPGDWEISVIDDPQFFIDFPLSAETDNIAVEIYNAELVPSLFSEDENVLRVYVRLTNKTGKTVSASWLMGSNAYQDGVSLPAGIPGEETETDSRYYNDIPAGETVELSACWEIRSDSPVEVTLSDDYGMNGVIAAATMPLN